LKLTLSLEEIRIIGSLLIAAIMAIGICFERIQIEEGGILILYLCGGNAIAEILLALKTCKYKESKP